MKDKLKKFFSNKQNKVTVIVVVIVVIVVVLVALLFKREKEKFVLNEIYDVYPEEVRELYSNMVSISCNGDLYIDVKLDSGILKVENIDRNKLMNYMFSYLDKNNLLEDEMNVKIIQNTANDLFASKINFDDLVNNFSYDGYTYTVSNNIIKRKSSECVKEKEYVSNLFGYSYNSNELSIDVEIGYMEDGNLFDLTGKKLGEYDGDVSKLGELFKTSPHYRYNFVLNNKTYKLTSIELKSRI